MGEAAQQSLHDVILSLDLIDSISLLCRFTTLPPSRPPRDAAESARKKDSVASRSGADQYKGNSFALGRRVIKKHVDEIEVNIKELEAGVGDASRQLQQSKDAKQHLKKNLSFHRQCNESKKPRCLASRELMTALQFLPIAFLRAS